MKYLAIALLLLSGCAARPVIQQQADNWTPTVATPQFTADTGPRVLVDAAHGNFHKIDGRFAAFAKLDDYPQVVALLALSLHIALPGGWYGGGDIPSSCSGGS